MTGSSFRFASKIDVVDDSDAARDHAEVRQQFAMLVKVREPERVSAFAVA